MQRDQQLDIVVSIDPFSRSALLRFVLSYLAGMGGGVHWRTDPLLLLHLRQRVVAAAGSSRRGPTTTTTRRRRIIHPGGGGCCCSRPRTPAETNPRATGRGMPGGAALLVMAEVQGKTSDVDVAPKTTLVKRTLLTLNLSSNS